MSFTYTQLKTAIKDYTENTEVSFVSHLSDFVKATEQRIFTTVDLEVFRKKRYRCIIFWQPIFRYADRFFSGF